MHFSAQSLPVEDFYPLIANSMVPRPIAWISTRSPEGVDNLAPYSMVAIASANPPVLSVTQLTPQNKPAKDTLNNLQATRECVVNFVGTDFLQAMTQTAKDYPADVSEFDIAHIERCESRQVRVCGVKAAAVRYECRLRDIIVIAEQPMGGKIILLNVIGITVDDRLLKDGAIDPSLIEVIGKLGGQFYCDTHNKIQAAKPQ